jgi:hypothetical protein
LAGASLHVVLEVQALAARLQLEHLHDLLKRPRSRRGADFQRQLAAFDARDVQRAFDQRQQVVAAAPDDADGLLAVRGHGRVFVQQSAHSPGCCSAACAARG